MTFCNQRSHAEKKGVLLAFLKKMQCKQSKTKTCKHNTKKERGLRMEYFHAMAKSACERFIESVQPVLSQSVSFCATRARARARRTGPTVRHGFCAILHQCLKILANELPQFRHSFSALVHMGGARCRGVASVWCRWVWSTAPVHLCTALVRAVKVMRQ